MFTLKLPTVQAKLDGLTPAQKAVVDAHTATAIAEVYGPPAPTGATGALSKLTTKEKVIAGAGLAGVAALVAWIL